jgi:nucleoside-diphosphate-sugar epimerase
MLGCHVVEALIESGVQVRAYARLSSKVDPLKARQVEVITGAPDDADAIRRAAAGVQWVFHAAGYLTATSPFEAGGPSSRYRAANVDLTETLLEASQESGVERFVYFSSNSVYAFDAAIPTPEDAPLQPVSSYGQSKLESEQLVCKYQELGLDTTIIRPCVIYGPGDRHFLPVAMRLARLPLLPLVDGGHTLFDLIHARDVADLALRACQSPAASGRIYNAGPGTPTSLRQLIDVYRKLSGRGPRIIPISARTVERTAGLVRPIASRISRQLDTMLSPTSLTLMSLDIHLDTSRAEADLGFKPRYSLEQGMADALNRSGKDQAR